MKIAVLTLNPGIDRIIYLPAPARLGTMNRASHTVVSQGSKGANVAIMLKTLGADPDYLSFTGGELSTAAESFTHSHKIRHRLTKTACGIRINTKVIDGAGSCTEFNEKGGPVSEKELEALLSELFSENYDIVIPTGSIPQGVENSVYNRIVSRFNASGALTILDCDGDVMKKALPARPSLIKPNLRELAGILDIPERELYSHDKIRQACRQVRGMYGCTVICTMDADGSIYSGEDGEYAAGVAEVPLAGFSGAGDTYLAAFVIKRYVEGRSVTDALRYATAAAGAKVTLPGTSLPDREQIERVLSQSIPVIPFVKSN